MPQKTTHSLPGIKVQFSQPLHPKFSVGKMGGTRAIYQQGNKLQFQKHARQGKIAINSVHSEMQWKKCLCLPLEAQIFQHTFINSVPPSL